MQTKGELITACVRLMNENDSEILNASDISTNSDFKNITSNIIESINRALSLVANLKKLPIKKYVFKPYEIPYEEMYEIEEENIDGQIYRIKCKKNVDDAYYYEYMDRFVIIAPNDFMEFEKVKYVGIYEDTSINATIDENYITLYKEPNYKGEYEIYYYPKFTERITYDTLDTQTFQTIPENILDIVPYFVKGELYEQEEPQIAALCTNKFFSYLDTVSEMNKTRQGKITRVNTIYYE